MEMAVKTEGSLVPDRLKLVSKVAHQCGVDEDIRKKFGCIYYELKGEREGALAPSSPAHDPDFQTS